MVPLCPAGAAGPFEFGQRLLGGHCLPLRGPPRQGGPVHPQRRLVWHVKTITITEMEYGSDMRARSPPSSPREAYSQTMGKIGRRGEVSPSRHLS